MFSLPQGGAERHLEVTAGLPLLFVTDLFEYGFGRGTFFHHLRALLGHKVDPDGALALLGYDAAADRRPHPYRGSSKG